MRRIILAAALAVVGGLAIPAAAQPVVAPNTLAACLQSANGYSIHVLPRPEGFKTEVFDLNNSNDAVGYMLDSALKWRALIWDESQNVTSLAAPGTVSMARGISEAGLIAGFHGASFSNTQPAVWDAGAITYLGTLGGQSPGQAEDVNDARVAVGYNHAGNPLAMGWVNWTPIHLANPFSLVSEINERTEAVGKDGSSGWFQAVYWNSPTPQYLAPLGANHEAATGISHDGKWIAGGALSPVDSKFHAVRWKGPGGPIQDLGTYLDLPTSAWDINSRGWAAGNYTVNPVSGDTLALIWDCKGRPVDPHTLLPVGHGWTLVDATGINDRGAIIGWGYVSSSQQAYIMIPN